MNIRKMLSTGSTRIFERKCMLILSSTVGLALLSCPFRLLWMYFRSSSEIHRCSAGVLLVRSVHSISVMVDVVPTGHAHHQVIDTATV